MNQKKFKTDGHNIYEDDLKIGIVYATNQLNRLYEQKEKTKDDLTDCRYNKQLAHDKLWQYYDICHKYYIPSSTKLEEFIEDLIKENQTIKNKIYTRLQEIENGTETDSLYITYDNMRDFLEDLLKK